MSVPEQIAVLLAVTEGVFDHLPPDQIAGGEQIVRQAVTKELPDLCTRVQSGDKLKQEDINVLINTARKAIYGRVPKVN